MNLMEKNIAIMGSNPSIFLSSVNEEMLRVSYIGGDDKGEIFFEEDRFYAISAEVDENNAPDAAKRELIMVIGINGVEEITWIIENAHPGSLFVVIEPEPSFVVDAIARKDLAFLLDGRVTFISQPMETLAAIFEKIFTSGKILLATNMRIYNTYYYRTYKPKIAREIVKILSNTVKYVYFTLGNDVTDSLIGLKNNLANLHQMMVSKDIAKLKAVFQGVPAFLIASGPSLEKNIQHLKSIKGRALIIAADTIVERLVGEGIKPDVMVSIERHPELYGYCYEGKSIPEKTALLAPLVIDRQVFDNFHGLKVIPLRENVMDNAWLDKNILHLGPERFFKMGTSVANLGFAFAAYTGASPLILVGQDLAFDETGMRSHSSGTIYDKEKFDLDAGEARMEIDGYFGGKVITTRLWYLYKQWFEFEMQNRPELEVINATEGGAKIAGTKQMSLKEAVEAYCIGKSIDVWQILNDSPNYPLSYKKVGKNITNAIRRLHKTWDVFKKSLNAIGSIKLEEGMSENQLIAVTKKMKTTDKLIVMILEDALMRHMLQPVLINAFNRYYKIEQKLEYIAINQNLQILIEFLALCCMTTQRVVEIFDSAQKEWITGENNKDGCKENVQ